MFSALTDALDSSPGASVGATPEILQMADKIIIEVNTKLPSFKGLHDIKSVLPLCACSALSLR